MTQQLERYQAVRKHSEDLCSPLEIEDYVVQPVAEVSPLKWHLAHTTWFFEELLLRPNVPNYQRFNEQFPVLFNSYYKAAGDHWIQGERGQLSRPTVKEIYAYRQYVDEHMQGLLAQGDLSAEAAALLELGFHHEQQHQELLLMDIKYILGVNPLLPAYTTADLPKAQAVEHTWHTLQEGVAEFGHEGASFAYDNELPRHKQYLAGARIRKNLVSNGEYLDFIQSKDYHNPKLWLSLGWDWKNSQKVEHPLYWMNRDGWQEFTLHGLQALDLHAPVTHISYFEADAFAAWAGARLPTEFEAEVYLSAEAMPQRESESALHALNTDKAHEQLWCWTNSHYSPYPGFKPFAGMVEEYNGKFMCGQFVLRGGCFATPLNHYRPTYRNFFLPEQRWMFSGIRIATD